LLGRLSAAVKAALPSAGAVIEETLSMLLTKSNTSDSPSLQTTTEAINSQLQIGLVFGFWVLGHAVSSNGQTWTEATVITLNGDQLNVWLPDTPTQYI
jgi:hypothetical protein